VDSNPDEVTAGRVGHLPVAVSTSKSLVSMYKVYLHVIKRIYMYMQYIQSLCQSKMGTRDHALLLVAPATTAVWSLERSYA
jgi:hypothetical protein